MKKIVYLQNSCTKMWSICPEGNLIVLQMICSDEWTGVKLDNVPSGQLVHMNLSQFNLTDHDIDLTLTCTTAQCPKSSGQDKLNWSADSDKSDCIASSNHQKFLPIYAIFAICTQYTVILGNATHSGCHLSEKCITKLRKVGCYRFLQIEWQKGINEK